MPLPADFSREPGGLTPSHRAIRLTFEYQGSEIRLIARQDIEKITPPSDPMPERRQEQSGFWVEIQSELGEPLYRRVMHTPIETSIEVRSDDPDHPFSRVPVDLPRGTFFVLIPALPRAESVVLFSSPIDPRDERAAMSPAREIARFDLRQRPERRRPEAPSPPVHPPEQQKQGRHQGSGS